jgi:hypothetical protein
MIGTSAPDTCLPAHGGQPQMAMTAMLDTQTQEDRHGRPAARVPSRHMAPPARKTLLEPGHEDEWAELNREKRKALTPAPDTPIGELLRRGQHLSAQAAGLLRAVERGNDGAPRP